LWRALRDGLDAAVAGEDHQADPPARPRWPYAPLGLGLIGLVALAFVRDDGGGGRVTGARAPLAAPPDCAPLSASLFPMAVGNWWRYRVVDPSTHQPVEKTIAFDREGDVGGARAGLAGFRLHRKDASGTAYRWLAREDGAVGFVHDEWYDLDGRRTRDVSYAPRRFRVSDACDHRRAGARWTESYERIDVDPVTGARTGARRIEEEWEVQAVDEEITVPAGTFRCLRLRRRSRTAGEYEDSTYWFAPGVGKVREDSPPEELEVLVEYHVEGG
jgi:hypothetical protein